MLRIDADPESVRDSLTRGGLYNHPYVVIILIMN